MSTDLCARAHATLALTKILRQGKSCQNLLDFTGYKLSSADQSFAKRLVLDSCRHYYQLKKLLNTLLVKSIKSAEIEVESALLIAFCQLIHLDIPAHAVVDQCLKSLEALHKGWAKGLANAVLRTFLREPETLLTQITQDEEALLGHPQWLIKRIRGAWGQQAGDAAMQAALQSPPMTLRIHQGRTQRNDYLGYLAAANLEAQPCALSPQGIWLKHALPVSQLPFFSEGFVSIQDEAAQLAALMLAPRPNERILDACSAPGGKSCHLLELEPNLALLALDADPTRLKKVEDNLKRLGLSATVQAACAQHLNDWWDGTAFDRILLDVPCSGTGVIRRHPDIKLLRRPDDIKALVQLQAELIKQLWHTLRSGGRMLYTTCSILPQENEEQIANFLARTKNAMAVPLALTQGRAMRHGHQLLPQVHSFDGFYFALLEKTRQTTA